MLDLEYRLNESLGNLNTGSSEFKEIVKVLLHENKVTKVTPNSNIVNFTVRDAKEVPKKVMQISSSASEGIAAIYLSNSSGVGVLVFRGGRAAFDDKITMTTPVNIIARDNSNWSRDIQLFYQKNKGRGELRFRDVADFDILGELSGSVIFEDPNVGRLRDERYNAQYNTDPLNLSDYERKKTRREKLETYKASKSSDFTRGEISFKEFSDIITAAQNERGISYEGRPSKVVLNLLLEFPKQLESNPIIRAASIKPLDDERRFSMIADIKMDIKTGRFFIEHTGK